MMSLEQLSKQETSPTSCYLQLNIRCSNNIRLSLRTGNTFSTPVYVTGSQGVDNSLQCIEIPCSASGRVSGETLIIGNQITVSPLDLSGISMFSNKEDCMTGHGNYNEDTLVTVTCDQQNNNNLEEQGQYC